jgi:hypothetical protein
MNHDKMILSVATTDIWPSKAQDHDLTIAQKEIPGEGTVLKSVADILNMGDSSTEKIMRAQDVKLLKLREFLKEMRESKGLIPGRSSMKCFSKHGK